MKIQDKEKSLISIILTSYNEERKISHALTSVEWADEIILVDGQSSDNTIQIAKQFPQVQIISMPNDPGMMSMRNKGINKASGKWILILDADEIIPPNLAKKIIKYIHSQEKHVAYRFPRKQFFLGKWIKHCSWFPDYQIRLFKKRHGYYKNQHVHEQVTITHGSIGLINIPFEHHSYYDFKEYLYKVHRYIAFEASILGKKATTPSAINYLLLRPMARFLSIYIRQKGILEGYRGLILSFFAGYHEFMTYIEHRKLLKGYSQSKTN